MSLLDEGGKKRLLQGALPTLNLPTRSFESEPARWVKQIIIVFVSKSSSTFDFDSNEFRMTTLICTMTQRRSQGMVYGGGGGKVC